MQEPGNKLGDLEEVGVPDLDLQEVGTPELDLGVSIPEVDKPVLAPREIKRNQGGSNNYPVVNR